MNSSVRGAIGRRARDPVSDGRLRRLGRHAANRRTASSSSTIPSPGVGRHAQDAVRAGSDRLGQHEVAPLGGPAGRVVGVFEVRPTADPGRDLEVGQQPDAVGPGVWREPAVAGEGELRDRPGVRQPGQHHVRLVDVERVGLERGEQLGQRPGHLAAGDPDAGRRGAQPGQAPQVRSGQRLLDPQDAFVGETRGDLASGHRIERA